MNRTLALVAAIVFFAAGTAYALYSVSDKGDWPNTWPKELESLRTQSRTFVGPQTPHRHHAIPFTKREEMEAAWPHLLKVISKGAAIRLVRGPNFFLGGGTAGVVVHAPPEGQPNAGEIYIELVVDGSIVDLNRLPLPPDTPITDERFKEAKNK